MEKGEFIALLNKTGLPANAEVLVEADADIWSVVSVNVVDDQIVIYASNQVVEEPANETT